MSEPHEPGTGRRDPLGDVALRREIRSDARRERRVVLLATGVAVLVTAAVLVVLAAVR